MRSANLSLTAGRLSHRSTNKAAVRLSEAAMLKIGTLLVAGTLVFTLAVFAFCNRQDERLASARIDIEQLVEEVRR